MCKFPILLVMVMCLSACSHKQAGESTSQQAVAKVNNYTITADDFNHEVGFLRPVFRSLSSIPPIELKLSILDEMINRELLLEEAQKINIDKDPEFMRQIENFWRLSLIKRLLKHKIAEIEASTVVSDDEIQKEYAREKAQMGLLKPLQEVTPQIKEIIFRRKVQKSLQVWEDTLKTKAVIKRYYGALNAILVGAGQGGANGQHK